VCLLFIYSFMYIRNSILILYRCFSTQTHIRVPFSLPDLRFRASFASFQPIIFFPAYPTCDFARFFDQSTRPKNTLGILSVRIAEIETPLTEADSFLAMREHLEILEAAPLLDEDQFSEDES
jgi:hypothetical protein